MRITDIVSLEIFVGTSGLLLLLGIHHVHQAPVTRPAARVGIGPVGSFSDILRILHENQIKIFSESRAAKSRPEYLSLALLFL